MGIAYRGETFANCTLCFAGKCLGGHFSSSDEQRAKRRAQAAAYAARKRKEEKAERLFSEALHRFDISVQVPRMTTIALQSPNEALRNERAERRRERHRERTRLRRQQLGKRSGKSSPPKTRWVPAERGEPSQG